MSGLQNDAHRRDLGDHQRLSALDGTGLLDAAPQAHFDRITELVAELLRCKVALISLVDTDRQFFLSQCGLEKPHATQRGTPLTHSFCQHVVTSRAPLVIKDARSNPLVAQNGAVVDLGVLAYLGIPIATRAGHVLGSLCAIEAEPRNWTPGEIKLLSKFARIVEDEIALGDRATDADIRADVSATLAREYHHRVKNALAVSSALVKLSARGASSINEVIEAASGRLSALATAHDSLLSTSDFVDVGELLQRLLMPYFPLGSAADVEGPPVNLRHQQITPFCLFLHELATNSAKYGAFQNHARVSVRWSIEPTNIVVLQWVEQLAEAYKEPPQSGFGSKLFAIAANQLGGDYATHWRDDLLVVDLSFPVVA